MGCAKDRPSTFSRKPSYARTFYNAPFPIYILLSMRTQTCHPEDGFTFSGWFPHSIASVAYKKKMHQMERHVTGTTLSHVPHGNQFQKQKGRTYSFRAPDRSIIN